MEGHDINSVQAKILQCSCQTILSQLSIVTQRGLLKVVLLVVPLLLMHFINSGQNTSTLENQS